MSDCSFILLSSSHSYRSMRSAGSLNSTRAVVPDKHSAILRAAIRVFANNGYFNSKVADIAREAGVADGTVYLYFKSKEEILHSIFDRSMEKAIADGKKQLADITDPREKLRRIALLHLERLGADRDLAVVFQVELRGSTKFMEEFSAAGFAEYLELIRLTFDEPSTLVEVFELVERRYKRPDTLNYKIGDAWVPISSDEMMARARRIAGGLCSMGIRPGDRIAI